ncbi:phosphate acyltransferase PlsX [Acidihalobacter ferrooxydans]|uniref:Phosphate acyltransferase n=1 Tax=Acidihalobacter ferrooxydans TaxID=1765967 RepID=A0A1P8UFR4_9GAMM|nr:phosphate acyltransferase PlsX [Acidihalobacter ferrooxydans]APZ42668.1 phosphate acyltransferase [Acidihalobacter ferrooxydans]
MIKIALDAMGGDFGVPVTVPAAVEAVRVNGGLELILVGDETQVQTELKRLGAANEARLSVRHTTQTVGMDEAPAQALRMKKDSSMRVCVNMVKSGEANACVSAGNTGALMATAKYVLKTLPGIDRPAICARIPAVKGHTYMLDLGANLDCSAEQLLQFAVMGSVLVAATEHKPQPKVGVLNVGQEDIKGNDQVKGAAKLLDGSGLNYIGFVEGNDVFLSDVDVVVCDGFAGNVALKTMEGASKTIAHFLREEFSRNWMTSISAAFAMPVLKALRQRIDPRKYNGASFLGLTGIVVKSHGSSDAVALRNAIEVARLEVEEDIPRRIDSQLEASLSARRTA